MLTTGEPLDLVPALLGLCLHLREKAVILEIFPGKVVRSPRLVFPGCRPAGTSSFEGWPGTVVPLRESMGAL